MTQPIMRLSPRAQEKAILMRQIQNLEKDRERAIKRNLLNKAAGIITAIAMVKEKIKVLDRDNES